MSESELSSYITDAHALDAGRNLLKKEMQWLKKDFDEALENYQYNLIGNNKPPTYFAVCIDYTHQKDKFHNTFTQYYDPSTIACFHSWATAQGYNVKIFHDIMGSEFRFTKK